MAVKEEIVIGSKADTRGFKVAESAAQKLTKSVKNLAAAFGVAYSTQKVIQFGIASVQAAASAEKANIRLANSVKNLGLSLATADIQSNLDDISRSAGIAGEVLVDAYQPLLQATGSIVQSQKMLQLALDVSAGSGVDLAEVSQDLANAYVGNFKSIKKYNIGLTQAELKTSNFYDIQKKLNEQYSGAQAQYLATYAGKMQILGEAAGDAQERIGGAIIDAGMLITGSADIQDLISKIETLTDKTIGWIDRFSEGIAIIRAIKDSNLGNISKNIQDVQVAAYNARLRRTYMDPWKGVAIPKTAAQIAQEKKASADAAKRAKELLAAQNKNTNELKKQAALKKAQTVFDKEQANLIAALKGKLSEDERRRAEAQLAILNGNDVLAKSLTEQILKAQDASGNLYKYFLSIGDAKIKNPFEFLDQWIIEFQKKLDKLVVSTPKAQDLLPAGIVAGYGDYAGSVANQYSNEVLNGSYGMQTALLPSDLAVDYNIKTGLSYNANDINLTITGDGDLTDAIANALQNKSLSSGNTAYINRRTGGFE